VIHKLHAQQKNEENKRQVLVKHTQDLYLKKKKRLYMWFSP